MFKPGCKQLFTGPAGFFTRAEMVAIHFKHHRLPLIVNATINPYLPILIFGLYVKEIGLELKLVEEVAHDSTCIGKFPAWTAP